MRIICAKNYADMSRKAANLISAQVILKPDSVLGLATGSSPEGVYAQLVDWYQKGDIDFSQVTTINLDEYVGLAPSHEQSYRHFMDVHLFNLVNINKDRTFLPDGLAVNVEEECQRYDKLLEQAGGTDLQLLGIGRNGHVAFNEPDECFHPHTRKVALTKETIEANSRFFDSMDDVPRFALSMGISGIMASKALVLVASGREKAESLKAAITGPVTPKLPASIIQFHQNVTVVADEDALSLL